MRLWLAETVLQLHYRTVPLRPLLREMSLSMNNTSSASVTLARKKNRTNTALPPPPHPTSHRFILMLLQDFQQKVLYIKLNFSTWPRLPHLMTEIKYTHTHTHWDGEAAGVNVKIIMGLAPKWGIIKWINVKQQLWKVWLAQRDCTCTNYFPLEFVNTSMQIYVSQ